MSKKAATGGRPRDPRVDSAVRAATIELLISEGYNRLTIQRVAAAAGVGHTSIYRRWGSKADLVYQVVFPDELVLDLAGVTDIGEAIRTMITGTVEAFAKPEVVAAIPGLLAAARDETQLRARIAARLEPSVHGDLRAAMAAASASGQISKDADLDILLATIAGAIIWALFLGIPADLKTFAERLAVMVERSLCA